LPQLTRPTSPSPRRSEAEPHWVAGFDLEFSTDHNSGQLRNGEGPYAFIAEVPEDREPQTQIVLKVSDADALCVDPAVEVVTPFEDTHYGTREMTVRDPDGRLWSLQAPAKS
jgi:uncharacterized glyoxalase superfamily protein PhnB